MNNKRIYAFVVLSVLQFILQSTADGQVLKRFFPRVPLIQERPPGTGFGIRPRFCPPCEFLPDYCPQSATEPGDKLADPNQFLKNKPKVPETDPSIDLNQPSKNHII